MVQGSDGHFEIAYSTWPANNFWQRVAAAIFLVAVVTTIGWSQRRQIDMPPALQKGIDTIRQWKFRFWPQVGLIVLGLVWWLWLVPSFLGLVFILGAATSTAIALWQYHNPAVKLPSRQPLSDDSLLSRNADSRSKRRHSDALPPPTS
jgi:hypothetical protein